MKEIENVYKDLNGNFTTVAMDIRYKSEDNKANAESLRDIVECFKRTKKFEYLIGDMNTVNLIKGENEISKKIEDYGLEHYDDKIIDRTLFNEFLNSVKGYISVFKNLYTAKYMRN